MEPVFVSMTQYPRIIPLFYIPSSLPSAAQDTVVVSIANGVNDIPKVTADSNLVKGGGEKCDGSAVNEEDAKLIKTCK